MKIKRCIMCMIVLIIGAIAGFIYLFFRIDKRNYFYDTQAINESKEARQEPSVTANEMEDLSVYIKKLIDEYLEEELAIIDPSIKSIQADGLNRYLVELDCVGIDNSYDIDMYHYYMVIHKNNEGRLYMMPFGMEVVKGEIEKVRQDLLVSMLKMVNSWGLKPDEEWRRWQETMLKMNYKNKEDAQVSEVGTVFYVQRLMSFINDYIVNNPEEAFIRVSKKGLYQEILDFEMMSITNINDQKECHAKVEAKVRVYENESIRDYQVEMTYEVVTHTDGTFRITEQKGRIK